MTDQPTSGQDARDAIVRADAKLRSQRAKASLVDRVVGSLRNLAEENHWSERVARLYRGDDV